MITAESESSTEVREMRQATPDLDKYGITREFLWECIKDDELGSARLISKTMADKLVYDIDNGKTGRWTEYNGHIWNVCATTPTATIVGFLKSVFDAELERLEFDVAAATTDADIEKYGELHKLTKRASKLAGTNKYGGSVAALAQGSDMLGRSGIEWDRKNHLLGVANGILDLKTGELVAPSADQFITRKSPTPWLGINVTAPKWEKFILDIMCGNAENAGHLQRAAGYSIDGSNPEQIAFFGIGVGSNGKSAMLESIYSVIGPKHAAQLVNDVLMASDKNASAGAATPHLMMLEGKRLGFTVETQDGGVLNERAFKTLVGNKNIVGRGVYKDYSTFNGGFVVWILTNHLPTIVTKNKGTLRRIVVIEFKAQFVENPKGENEYQLINNYGDHLVAEEGSGILAWLVRGLMEYNRIGFNTPESVKAATERYKDTQAGIEAFIAEFIEQTHSPEDEMLSMRVYAAYEEWCKAAGVEVQTKIKFNRLLNASNGNQKPVRSSEGNRPYVYQGYRIKEDDLQKFIRNSEAEQFDQRIQEDERTAQQVAMDTSVSATDDNEAVFTASNDDEIF